MTQTTMQPPRLETLPSLGEPCDRCTAAAKLRIVLPAGGDLVFCGHHANHHADDILRNAAGIWLEDGFEWRGAARISG